MIIWNKKNLDRINNQLLKVLNKTATDTLSNITDEKVVPYHYGTLQNSGYVSKAQSVKNIAKVGWDTPYARRLYFHPEYRFRNGRIGRWADNWIFGSKRNWILKTFQHNAKKELK